MSELWPWVTLAALGAYHGLNPGMGWLFAVALGLQERSRKAVIRAFAPIALGHAVSIAAVVALVAALQSVVSPTLLRYVGAGALVAFGLYKLLAPMSHPRWVGMRVGARDLAVWSFLMATAHGAGLMLVPVLLRPSASPPPALRAAAAAETAPAEEGKACHTALAQLAQTPSSEDGASGSGGDRGGHAGHTHGTRGASPAGIAGPVAQLGAVALHTGAMFVVMALVALTVFEKVGLAILRRAWLNLDLLWAGALVGAGVLVLLV